MSKITRRLLLGIVSIAGAGLGTYYYKNPKTMKKHKKIIKEKLNTVNIPFLCTEKCLENKKNKEEIKNKVEEIVSSFVPKDEKDIIQNTNNEEKNIVKELKQEEHQKEFYNDAINLNITSSTNNMKKIKPIEPVDKVEPVKKIDSISQNLNIKNEVERIKEEIKERKEKNSFPSTENIEKHETKEALDSIVSFFSDKIK